MSDRQLTGEQITVTARLAEIDPMTYKLEQFGRDGTAPTQEWNITTLTAWLQWHLSRGRVQSLSIVIVEPLK